MRTILSFLACLFLFAHCSSPENKESRAQFQEWMSPNGKIKVLVTTSMIGDIAKTIGGEQVDTWVLIHNGLDPHSYQLVKGDDDKLAHAQVILANGLGLEHHPSIAHHLENNPRAILLGDHILQAYPERLIRIDGTPDPHIWMDISLWEETVPLVVQAYSKLAPEHAQEFQARGQALQSEMQHTHTAIQTQMQRVPAEKRFLVSSHDAFNYFGRAYLAAPGEAADQSWMKRVDAPEGLAPESQLSPSHIQAILDHLKKYDVSVIFPESNLSRDCLRKIIQAGQEKGLGIVCSNDPLYSDAMGEPGSSGDTYLKMIQHNADTISRNLTQN